MDVFDEIEAAANAESAIAEAEKRGAERARKDVREALLRDMTALIAKTSTWWENKTGADAFYVGQRDGGTSACRMIEADMKDLITRVLGVAS